MDFYISEFKLDQGEQSAEYQINLWTTKFEVLNNVEFDIKQNKDLFCKVFSNIQKLLLRTKKDS
jgi:hypothetical protein